MTTLYVTCPECHGEGELRKPSHRLPVRDPYYVEADDFDECPTCHGGCQCRVVLADDVDRIARELLEIASHDAYTFDAAMRLKARFNALTDVVPQAAGGK